MTRRKLIATTAAAGTAAAQLPAAKSRQYLRIRKLFLRNSADNQAAVLATFLEKSALPAAQRSGATAVGCFAALIAPDSPFYLFITSYPSLAAMEASMDKMAADAEYQKAQQAFDNSPGQHFVRYETSVLRTFTGWPDLTAPPAGKSGRVFELRTYESDDQSSLAQKIRMFNEGEIAIFRKTGLEPVFFGETVFGQKQPNLTYMLWYDDLAAREANWKKFVAHPEWTKLKGTPGWSDGEIVSNISNIMLRALPFSPII